MKHINYVILDYNIIETLDFSLKRSKERVYLEMDKESIRYNTNKFFFKIKKELLNLGVKHLKK